jgi:hypothetical protein
MLSREFVISSSRSTVLLHNQEQRQNALEYTCAAAVCDLAQNVRVTTARKVPYVWRQQLPARPQLTATAGHGNSSSSSSSTFGSTFISSAHLLD